jgi:hypothetical protein
MYNRICPNCGHFATQSFCGHCGEKYFDPAKKQLSSIAGEAFHFLTHADGLIWRNLKTMMTNPGKLSADFCQGARKKYYKPFSFFLLLNLLIFIFPSSLAIYKAPIGNQTNSGFLKDVKKQMVNAYLAKGVAAKESFTQKYDAVAPSFSKALLFIMIFALAFWMYLITIGSKKFLFYDHFIAATEIVTFHLTALILVLIPILLLRTVFPSLDQDYGIVENFLVTFILLSWHIYAFFLLRRFYQFTKLGAFIRVVFMFGGFLFMVEVFRMSAFLWTFYYVT